MLSYKWDIFITTHARSLRTLTEGRVCKDSKSQALGGHWSWQDHHAHELSAPVVACIRPSQDQANDTPAWSEEELTNSTSTSVTIDSWCSPRDVAPDRGTILRYDPIFMTICNPDWTQLKIFLFKKCEWVGRNLWGIRGRSGGWIWSKYSVRNSQRINQRVLRIKTSWTECQQ